MNYAKATLAGKEKCKYLRSIRQMLAEKYKINYTPIECTYDGPCKGTCPACDSEIRYLENQILNKYADKNGLFNYDDYLSETCDQEELRKQEKEWQSPPPDMGTESFTLDICDNPLNDDEMGIW